MQKLQKLMKNYSINRYTAACLLDGEQVIPPSGRSALVADQYLPNKVHVPEGFAFRRPTGL